MNSITKKTALPAGLGLLVGFVALSAESVCAQTAWPFAPPTNPMAQQNYMNLVLNQVRWFHNVSRSAASYSGGGYGVLVQQFQGLRDQYAGFKSSLTPNQLNSGANQLAELDAGLDIIQEAFTDYQTAVTNGQSSRTAYSNMSRVLNEAITVWGQQFRQTCNQLQVGR